MKARILILLGFVFLFSWPSHCQLSDSVVRVKEFPGATVGAKTTAAMANCPAGPTPCIVFIDPSLAVWPQGTMPAMCATCTLYDLRVPGSTFNLPGVSSDDAFGLKIVGGVTSGASLAVGAPGAVTQSCSSPPGSDTDDATTLIQTAINNAATAGQTLVVGGCYNTNAKIVFPANADFSGATFYVWGSPTVAAEVSTGSATNPTDNLLYAQVKLPTLINMGKPSTGWLGQGIGARIVNCHSCRVWLNHIQGFLVGEDFTAYGSTGTVYSQFYLGYSDNNYTGALLESGDGVGWVNENPFYGGRFTLNSAEGSNVAGSAKIQIDNSPTVSPDGNTFFKPSLEGNESQWNLVNGGSDNLFIGARWEVSNPYNPQVLYDASSSQGGGNVIQRGVNASAIQTTYCGPLWAANAAYTASTTTFATYGGNLFVATVTGTSGSSAPTAFTSPTPTVGQIITDNTVTWQTVAVGLCPASPDATYTNTLDATKGYWQGITNPSGLSYQNSNSGNPIFRFFDGSAPLMQPYTSGTSTNWTEYLSSQYFSFKQSSDAYARLTINATNGEILSGNGTAAPGCYFAGGSTTIPFSCSPRPTSAGTIDLGTSADPWGNVWAAGYIYGGSGIYPNGSSGGLWKIYSTAPSGGCTSGALFTNSAGAANTALYPCVGGAWVPMAPLASPAFTGTPTINSLNAAVTVANGTAALGTTAISSGACASTVTATATGVQTTDSIGWSFNAVPDSTYNGLTVKAYPTAGNVNFSVCNPTAGSITPAAATLNWRVAR